MEDTDPKLVIFSYLARLPVVELARAGAQKQECAATKEAGI